MTDFDDAQGVLKTVDALSREIANARCRLELVALLSEPGRYDFDALDDAWGGED